MRTALLASLLWLVACGEETPKDPADGGADTGTSGDDDPSWRDQDVDGYPDGEDCDDNDAAMTE